MCVRLCACVCLSDKFPFWDKLQANSLCESSGDPSPDPGETPRRPAGCVWWPNHKFRKKTEAPQLVWNFSDVIALI